MKTEIGVGLLLTAITSAAVGWLVTRKKRETVPTSWVEVGKIEALYVYPLKSGGPLACTEFDCTKTGPTVGESRDRVVVVIREEDGSMVTGRDYPLLTQLTAEVKNGVLRIAGKKEEDGSVTVNVNELPTTPRQNVKIFVSYSNGVDCGDEVAAYLSKYNNAKLRLLYFPDRNLGKHGEPDLNKLPFVEPMDAGVYSDKCSFLIVNKASVNELNARLETPVTSLNFRPNIVVSGEKLVPYEEDGWVWLKIGECIFRVISPCTRCLFTTVNPETGEKAATFEPLKTLRKYRILRGPTDRKNFGLAPVMGQFLGLRSAEGPIKIGDSISVAVS